MRYLVSFATRAPHIVTKDIQMALQTADDARQEGKCVEVIAFRRGQFAPQGRRVVMARSCREVYPGYPRTAWLVVSTDPEYTRMRADITARAGNLTVRAPGWYQVATTTR